MILNIFKPKGITSYDCIRIIKYIFRYSDTFVHIPEWKKVIKKYAGGKIGHAGTLDPFAEGVLIICTDQDTKKISEIQSQPKEYIAGIKFGFISNTYDKDGDITIVRADPCVRPAFISDPCVRPAFISDPCVRPAMEKINHSLQSHFTGEILQTPPIFSAKKINGKRAYNLARAGKSVKLEKKKVIIYNIGVNKYDYPNLELIINCGSGTYIRSIAHDLGQLLKVGAYCHTLSRTKIGDYAIKNAIKLPPDQIDFILNTKSNH